MSAGMFNEDESYVAPLNPAEWQEARCGKCQLSVGKMKGFHPDLELRCNKASCNPDPAASGAFCAGSYAPAPQGVMVQPQACTACSKPQMILSDGRFKQHYKPGHHPSEVRATNRKGDTNVNA